MIIGTIQAFQEAANIGGAVTSLLEAGCDRVVVVDGAWQNPDGTPFGGGDSWVSTDGTREAAVAAGAEFVVPAVRLGNDGAKRDFLIHAADAGPGDHLILLDADERLHGRLTNAPAGHGCVVLRNDKPNDLPGRTPWLDQANRASVPMLRWLRWSPTLRCAGPGRYVENGEPIRVYLIEALAARVANADWLELAALAALREAQFEIPNDHLTILPLVPGVEISHCVPAGEGRMAAKHAYYASELATA